MWPLLVSSCRIGVPRVSQNVMTVGSQHEAPVLAPFICVRLFGLGLSRGLILNPTHVWVCPKILQHRFPYWGSD